MDSSCLSWHGLNDPGTEWQCADPIHVLANHVTTPFFVRHDLQDQLLMGNYVTHPAGGATLAAGQNVTL